MKKGLIRLWIASSFVWVFCTSWLLVPEAISGISNLASSSKFEHPYTLAIQLRTGDLFGAKKEEYEEAVHRGVIPQITFGRNLSDEELISKSLVEQLRGSTVFVGYLNIYKEFIGGSKPYEIWEVYRPGINNERLKFFVNTVDFVIGPPLAILLSGLMFGWVYRGFSATDNNT